MKQRLGIADVLLKDPKIIIMDEPTLGIDPQGMRDLLSLIRELSEKDGRTILLSSHQLYQVQQICDRVGIFVAGSLIACGRIEELGRQIAREGHFTLEIGARPLDDRLLAFLRSMEGLKDIEKEGDRLVIQSSRDLREDISRFLVSHDYALLHLRQKGGDLDEIYRCYFEKAEQDGEKHDKKQKRQAYLCQKCGTERRKVRNHSLAALYRKEMTDHITSKRFVIIMILVLATTIASITAQ